MTIEDQLAQILAGVAQLGSRLLSLQKQNADLTDQLAAALAAPSPSVMSGLEYSPAWIQPGNVGDDGGGSSRPAGKGLMTPPDGASLKVHGAYPYNDFYWYRPLPGDWSKATKFTYEFEGLFPTQADLEACQAIEFELEQCVGGLLYNMAWQADLKDSKLWRVFNYTSSRWGPTALAVDLALLAPGKPFAVQVHFFRNQDATLTHVTLALNGAIYPIGLTHAGTKCSKPDSLHVAFQLDSDGLTPPTPYNFVLRNIRVEVS